MTIPRNIACIGGGPGSLYFAILMKKAFPDAEITVFEREKRGVTWGFGVVFSDATMAGFAAADRPTYDAIYERFRHWDNIDIFYQGQKVTSTGHGFAGMSRVGLLDVLERRAEELGVTLRFEAVIEDPAALDRYDLVIAGDGINSIVRERFKEHLKPRLDWRRNKFVWFGTTRNFPDAFTFFFREDGAGLWRVHAYQFDDRRATFLVECTEETWKKSGMDRASEDETVAYLENLFAEELDGHRLLKNKSVWRTFPTIANGRWFHDKFVLIGDALHTAHFSIGSGTKLAMEDGIALVKAFRENKTREAALAAWEAEWRPSVESLQRSAKVSLSWFEDVERYHGRLEPLQFAYSLLTRSLRINHDNLKLRDPELVQKIDAWFAEKAARDAGIPPLKTDPPPPPVFTPFHLRGMTLSNRIAVSPMCQYMADQGTVGDWHIVHYGSRAMGGAGLIFTEMTAVAADARITPGCAGIYDDAHVGAWKRVIDFIHGNSAAKVCLQLGHAGRKGSTRLAWEGMDKPLDEGNWEVVGPSAIPYTELNQVPRAMTRADMDRVRDQFVEATKRAARAGFDMVEVHFAHGYLLSTFLSPLTNTRDDDYGGSIENRMRYPLEVFDAVRAAWPENRPVSVRISATDWVDGGFAPDDAVAVARMLKSHRCDIIDVSAGQVIAEQEPEYGRLFQTPFSERVRLEAEIPTITVGNISSYADAASILAAGRADLCAIARAHLFDPYWTRHAAKHWDFPLPWPAPYASVRNYTPRFE